MAAALLVRFHENCVTRKVAMMCCIVKVQFTLLVTLRTINISERWRQTNAFDDEQPF